MKGAGGDPWGREYERHRGVVLAMLAKRFPRLDEDERLAIYHDAWLRAYAKRERGEVIVSLRAYLLATAGAEALHVLSRGKVPTPIGPDDPRLATLVDDAPPVDEQVVTRDQARIARGLLDSLDARQRDVLKLRLDLQLTAGEVRAALGLSERQYRRLAEEGAIALARRVEELDSGQWSRRTRSLLVACLVEVTRGGGERRVGIASRRQREEAQRLLDSDPHVAALYAEVRRRARGAAALLPLPTLALDDAVVPPLAHAVELLAGARDHFADAIDAIRRQAMSVYLRVADPALLGGGPRPGAAVLSVVGALAVSGGAYATYEATSASEPRPAPAPALQPASPALTASPAPPTPIRPRPRPTPKPDPQPTPTEPPTPPNHQPTPQPQPTQPSQPTEFGFED